MAGGILEAIKEARERRKERTKTTSSTFDVNVDGKTEEAVFEGTIKTSRSGRKTVEKLEHPRFGKIKTKKKKLKKGKGETVKVKKRFSRV